MTLTSADFLVVERHKNECVVPPDFKMEWRGCPYADNSVESFVCSICGVEFWKEDKKLYTLKQYYSGRYAVRRGPRT